ncbi:mechanosensitive ion channel [Conexibacter sp. W3-3-2]|uniref:mechanosensitive ion channel family protein n=1 Tax=Conexibacter sp. W3-3-2 TaxID=2675227 RepID=UPI0012B8DAC3|nr:mechanosensitive ion channel domain-containing protein [Conexibacter sp. W3-3-2]MTD45622.1 mechanosensitive ion channel [Conexibacter sp. W3-3-2]
MPPYILAETFFTRYDNQLTAALSLVIAFALAALVDRVIVRRATALATIVRGGELSAEADTRVRFLRRVTEVTIVVIGLGVALSQFAALDRIAGTVLASSAIAAAVVGFAARQVLANAIAGMQIAITQPLRVGDQVTFEGETGTVEDVRLTSTWLRTGTDSRVIIPNEKLAAGVLRNESIESATVAVEVSVWIRPDADEAAALAAVQEALPDVQVRIAESTFEGIRLLILAAPTLPSTRPAHEADIRATALAALRGVGAR